MIDILTAAVIFLFIFIGYKTGFMRSVYRVAAFIAGIIMAYILFEPVKNILIKLGTLSKIENLTSFIYAHDIDYPEIFGEDILPGYMKSMIANGQVTLSDAVRGFLSTMIINIITFLLVFITVRILIAIIGRLLHIASKLPVISFFDHGLGACLGIVESVMLIYLVLALAYAAIPIRQNVTLKNYISESTLTKTMYENNPIIKMIAPTDYENLI